MSNSKILLTPKNIRNYIGAFILAVFSILSQYSLKIISIGMVLLLIYSLYIIFQKGKIIFNRGMLYFVLFSLLHQLLVYFVTDTFFKNINTYFFMIVSIIMIAGGTMIEKEKFIKMYSMVSVVVSLFIIYQFIQINFFGVSVSPIRLFSIAKENLHYWNIDTNRPVSFFSEPQAYCSYIIPLLIYKISKKNMKFSVFLTLTILMSGSSQGILVSAFVWSYYIVIQEKRVNSKLGYILMAIIFICILFGTDIFEFALGKIESINIFGYDVRLTKGFMIYTAMPFIDKIVGIGYGNLDTYLRSGLFYFKWMMLTRPEIFSYITTMANVLVSYGVGGFLFYINIFKKNWDCKEAAKILLLVILIISFSQTILFNAWYVFYWIVFSLYDIDSGGKVHYIVFNFKKI